MTQHTGNRASLKQIGIVHQYRFHQPLLGLTYLQSQIEVSCLAVPFIGLTVKPGSSTVSTKAL